MLPGKKFGPADILQILRRRFWLIVIPPLVTIFPALLYSSTIHNMYQSDMLVAIDPQRVPDSFVRSTVTLGTDVRMEAISVQVKSRTNLQRMIESLDLYRDERRAMPMEDVVVKMRDSIKVNMEKSSKDLLGRSDVASSFHVLFTYPDPNIAAQVTQQLGTLFVEQNSRDRGTLANATNTFLETQLAEARGRLEEQEHKLEAFRQKHGKELPTQMQGNLQALQSMQLQVQSMVESIARDRDRKQMLERLQRESLSAPPTVEPLASQPAAGPAGPAVSSTASPEEKLAAARGQLANLELRYKPDHPDIVRIKRIIADLEPRVKEAQDAKSAEASASNRGSAQPAPVVLSAVSPLEQQRRERIAQMAAEIESVDRQLTFKSAEEEKLRAEIAEYQRRVEAVPGLESEWVSLTRDYDTQQLAYKELLTKSGAARVAVNLEEQQIGEHFRIVDPATVPVRPLPSIRLQVNSAGLALGLFLGIGIAALLEFKDGSYRSDADIVEVLALPVLASVPYVETEDERRRYRRRAILLSTACAAYLVGAGYAAWSLKLWHSIN